MDSISDTVSVRDRVVMITGAGQGIGRTYALAFARAGARVAVVELDAVKATQVASEISAEGGCALAVVTDVSSPDSVRAATERIAAEFGPVEILINNAAMFTVLGRQSFDKIPFEEWERVMRVNVTGSWLCAASVAEGMRSAKWGRIINISSSTVPLGLPMFAHYVTSKAAVIGLTRTMATELGPHGVTVNCVLPGLTETEVENPGRNDAIRNKVIDLQCVKRLGVPEDLVGMMLFLASPASSFITGQSIAVDGGSVFL
jgi:NAD(P)-dependent dehydrogenase (short-subunit alcohol dehydrogenase family)